MTTQYIRTAIGVPSLSGLICKLFDTANTDTVSYTSDSVSEAANAVGTYVFTFGESSVIPQQWWRIVVVDGSGNLKRDGFGYFLGADGELVDGVSQPVRSSVSSVSTPTIERSTGDTKAISFAWPVSGATITGERSTNQGSYTALTGAISYLRQDGDSYWYSLAYNSADRDSSENNVRYKFTDGTYTRWLNLRLTTSTSGLASQTSVDTLTTYVDTEVAAIKAKTDNLPTDPADQSAVEAAITSAVSTIQSTQASNAETGATSALNTYDPPTNTEMIARTLPSGEYGTLANQSTILTNLSTISGYIDTEIAAIKAKTDNLPADPTSTTDINTQLTTLKDRAGYLLSILAGQISNAGTSAEQYVITIDGNTFTVTYNSLQSDGDRGTTGFAKT